MIGPWFTKQILTPYIYTIIMDNPPAIQNGIVLGNWIKNFRLSPILSWRFNGQSFWVKYLNLLHTQQITAHECIWYLLFSFHWCRLLVFCLLFFAILFVRRGRVNYYWIWDMVILYRYKNSSSFIATYRKTCSDVHLMIAIAWNRL